MTDGPLTALVEFQIRTEATSMEEWLDVWSVRGEDALTGEPETTAYEAARSMQDGQNVLIFERYANGSASLAAHSERAAHKALHQRMGERNMTRRRVMSNLFTDISGYGWWSRPEQTQIMRDAGLRITLIGTRFPTEDMKQRYIELTGEHAEYCRDAEPGTLVYSGGLAVRDADRGPALRQGDLLFVAVFADDTAETQHRDDPQHVALQPRLAEVERERVFVQSYRTTGRGFLWSD